MTNTKPMIMATHGRGTNNNKYNDPRWQKKRLEIFSRDGFACTACGEKEKQLSVHHIIYRKTLWDGPDLEKQTLCEECHQSIGKHPKGGVMVFSDHDGDVNFVFFHCPICGNNSREKFIDKGTYDKCGECGYRIIPEVGGYKYQWGDKIAKEVIKQLYQHTTNRVRSVLESKHAGKVIKQIYRICHNDNSYEICDSHDNTVITAYGLSRLSKHFDSFDVFVSDIQTNCGVVVIDLVDRAYSDDLFDISLIDNLHEVLTLIEHGNKPAIILSDFSKQDLSEIISCCDANGSNSIIRRLNENFTETDYGYRSAVHA
jgi:hypothetical protein